MSSYGDFEPAKIAIIAVNSMLAILNITGNSLVCAIVLKNRDMRTSFNYILVNLAVADMTVATFLAPRYVFRHTFTHPEGVSGSVLCRIVTGGDLAWIASCASVFTLVAIATERYYSIMYPLGDKGKLTDCKLKVIILCSWIFGVVIDLPEILVRTFDNELDSCTLMWPKEWMGKAHSLIWFLAVALFPVMLMAVLYSRVVHALWWGRTEPNGGSACRQQGVLKVRKRVTLMAITVSVIFGLCWILPSTSYILSTHIPDYNINDATHAAAHVLIMFNSAINPIVYALVNQRFREKIKRMICCICRPASNSINEIQGIEVINMTTD